MNMSTVTKDVLCRVRLGFIDSKHPMAYQLLDTYDGFLNMIELDRALRGHCYEDVSFYLVYFCAVAMVRNIAASVRRH